MSDDNDADPTDGDVYCFGANQDKQLGQASTSGTCDDIYTGMGIDCESSPKKVNFPGSVSGISQVCGGYNYTCAIAEPDGTVYCWGDFYQSGINTSYAAPIPEGTTNIKEIACGMRHACVLSDSGSVTCFGDYVVPLVIALLVAPSRKTKEKLQTLTCPTSMPTFEDPSFS